MWTSVCGEDHAAPGNTSQATCAGIASETHQGEKESSKEDENDDEDEDEDGMEPKTKTKTKSSTSSIGQHLLDNRRFRKRWRRLQILQFCGDDRRIRVCMS